MKLRNILSTLILAALLALGLAAQADAAATIYAAATEDAEYSGCVGTCTVSTASVSFDPAFSRESSSIVGTTTDPPTNRSQLKFSSAISNFYFHAVFYDNNSATTISAAQGVRFLDGANARLMIRGTGTASTVKISKRTAAGVFTDLLTCSASWPASGGGYGTLDIFVNYAVSGEVKLYWNGVSFCDYTGDVTTDSATTLSSVELANITNTVAALWSQVLVSDSSTLAAHYLTGYPSSSGNQTQWSGSSPCTTSILAQTTINNANFVATVTNNQFEQCAISFPSTLSGSWVVDAVNMSANVEVGTTGPQHFQFVTRTGGSNFNSGSNAPTTSFSNFNGYLQTTNPNTSAGWNLSDVTAAGFNIGLESIP